MSHLAAYKIIQTDILGKIATGEFRPGTRIPTEADFMKQYNVSRITVQRALNELKQQGVLMRKPRAGTFVRTEAAAGLSAAASASAKSFEETGRLKLGIVAPFDMTASGTYQYLNGIMQVLTPSRDNVSLHNTSYDKACERVMLQNCIEDGCNGILYYPGVDYAPPLDLLIQIEKTNYPCVLIDKKLPNVNLPCVQMDNYTAAYETTLKLIKMGHRNIVFLSEEYASTVYERYAGFCQAMQEAGLAHLGSMNYSLSDPKWHGGMYHNLIEHLLTSGVTAVLCLADNRARVILDACIDMKIDVPGRLTIASFDGDYPGVITSVLQPYADIGRVSAEILLKWILTNEVERTTTMLPGTLLEGRTT